MRLTSRQKTLLARATELAALAHRRALPIEVLEIYGFGSFFRGKARPKDVDLLIRCTREHGRAFAFFRDILHHVCSEVGYQHDFERPLAAFLHEYALRHANMIPGLVSLEEERELFTAWLEPYSWSMVFPKSVPELPAWDDPFGFMRRLLRKHFPNLNVVSYLYPDTAPDQFGLRAGFAEIIWSREQPNIQQNIVEVLAPERVLVNTKKELQNFDRQLFLLGATFIVLEAKVHRSLGRSSKTFPDDLLRILQTDGALLTEDEAKSLLGLTREQQQDSELDSAQLAAAVEARRAAVTELWSKVEAVREVERLLFRYKNRQHGPRMTPKDFVSAELLRNKSAAQQRLLTQVLEELKLPNASPH